MGLLMKMRMTRLTSPTSRLPTRPASEFFLHPHVFPPTLPPHALGALADADGVIPQHGAQIAAPARGAAGAHARVSHAGAMFHAGLAFLYHVPLFGTLLAQRILFLVFAISS
jgi:hypothetical protein